MAYAHPMWWTMGLAAKAGRARVGSALRPRNARRVTMNARLVNAEAYAHQLQTVTHAHAPKDAPAQLVKMVF